MTVSVAIRLTWTSIVLTVALLLVGCAPAPPLAIDHTPRSITTP